MDRAFGGGAGTFLAICARDLGAEFSFLFLVLQGIAHHSFVCSSSFVYRTQRLTKPARDQKRFASDPFGIVRGEEDRSGSNVFRFSDATERSLRFKHFPHIAFSVTAGYGSFRYHHAWVDGIDADFSRSEFLRQSARDRIHCALRRVVNHRSRGSQRAGKRTDVNDASAIRIEVLKCFLSGKKHSENVGVKLPMKFSSVISSRGANW